MSIEIKQLIVKSTLVGNTDEPESSGLATEDLETFRQELIEQCREMVERSLAEIQER